MRSKVGIFHLFGENKKARKAFWDYCSTSDEFCEYDLELLEIKLGIPVIDNTDEFVHFHTGNIIDWLQIKGYFIAMKISNSLKYVPVVYHAKDNQKPYPLYHNAGMADRLRAWETAVAKAIDHLEQNL